MAFNELSYTRDAISKQLALMELHAKDGSATESGCECIEGKHLLILEGLAEEGQGFTMNPKEKKMYSDLANWSREMRKNIETETWKLPGNPSGRRVCTTKKCRYERCVIKLKPKQEAGEIKSAYAVCRASIYGS